MAGGLILLVVVLAVASAAGFAIRRRQGRFRSTGGAAAVPAAAPVTVLTATVMYRAMGWGTQLAAKVSGIPVGTKCQMWAIGAGGTRTLVGSWDTDNREGTVWYPASAAVPAGQMHGFVITVGTSSSITVQV